jgi:hypothetical protein
VVGAVVVDHVAVAHPLQVGDLLRCEVEVRRVLGLGAAPRHAGRRLAPGDVVVAVVGDEGRARPVRLDAAALRRPVLRVPQAAVDALLLPRRERNALVFLNTRIAFPSTRMLQVICTGVIIYYHLIISLLEHTIIPSNGNNTEHKGTHTMYLGFQSML